MEGTLPQTIGIGISKVALDVFAYPASCERRFSKTNKGHNGRLSGSLMEQLVDNHRRDPGRRWIWRNVWLA
ncbi:hypothetical protein J2X73_002096 [Novosphingobium sp. 1748]|nr:hypothetical protein [Novosphingobium sp. 1748]